MEGVQAKFEYDPNKINITERICSVGNLLGRLKERRLVYDYNKSDFTSGWNTKVKSSLIESVLIRLPIHSFLIDATSVRHWIVREGSSSLSTFDEFVSKESFVLEGLEYLSSIEGLRFSELEPRYQRRLQETDVRVHTIDAGTPPAVKFNIIERFKLHG